MAQVGNWILELSLTSGTGSIELIGPPVGFISWVEGIPEGRVWYALQDGDDREAGTAVFTPPNVLTRDDVRATLISGVYNDDPSGPIFLSGDGAQVACTHNASAFVDFETNPDLSLGDIFLESLTSTGNIIIEKDTPALAFNHTGLNPRLITFGVDDNYSLRIVDLIFDVFRVLRTGGIEVPIGSLSVLNGNVEVPLGDINVTEGRISLPIDQDTQDTSAVNVKFLRDFVGLISGNTTLAGTYDTALDVVGILTDLAEAVTGTGFVEGVVLPIPNPQQTGFYFVFDSPGTVVDVPGLPSQIVQPGDWLLCTGTAYIFLPFATNGLTVEEGDLRYVNLTGDTMTGPLIIQAGVQTSIRLDGGIVAQAAPSGWDLFKEQFQGASESITLGFQSSTTDTFDKFLQLHRFTNTSGIVQTVFHPGDGSGAVNVIIDHKTGRIQTIGDIIAGNQITVEGLRLNLPLAQDLADTSAANVGYVNSALQFVTSGILFGGFFQQATDFVQLSTLALAAPGTGFVDGGPLPAANAENAGFYFLVDEDGLATYPGFVDVPVSAGDWIASLGASGGWAHLPYGNTGITLGEADARYLQLTGGTLTGDLVIASGLNPRLQLSDGTVSGFIQIASGELNLSHAGVVAIAIDGAGGIKLNTPVVASGLITANLGLTVNGALTSITSADLRSVGAVTTVTLSNAAGVVATLGSLGTLNSDFNGPLYANGQLYLQPQGALYLDGGVNTYIYESSVGNIGFVSTGVQTFNVDASGVYVPSTKNMRFFNAHGTSSVIQGAILGYTGSNYEGVQIGGAATTQNIFLGIDPTPILGGNFTGTGQVFINPVGILTNNLAGTDWIPLIHRDIGSDNVLLAGVVFPGSFGIAEAPVDGNTYGRLNAAWALITTPQPGVPDAPSDGTSYARQDAQWDNSPNFINITSGVGIFNGLITGNLGITIAVGLSSFLQAVNIVGGLTADGAQINGDLFAVGGTFTGLVQSQAGFQSFGATATENANIQWHQGSVKLWWSGMLANSPDLSFKADGPIGVEFMRLASATLEVHFPQTLQANILNVQGAFTTQGPVTFSVNSPVDILSALGISYKGVAGSNFMAFGWDGHVHSYVDGGSQGQLAFFSEIAQTNGSLKEQQQINLSGTNDNLAAYTYTNISAENENVCINATCVTDVSQGKVIKMQAKDPVGTVRMSAAGHSGGGSTPVHSLGMGCAGSITAFVGPGQTIVFSIFKGNVGVELLTWGFDASVLIFRVV